MIYEEKPRVAFHTLGCKVNMYETQALIERFEALGFDVVYEDDIADVYVINSCTVTGTADKKSRNFVRRSKRANPGALTALVGCYAQVMGDDLGETLPEADILLGNADKHRLPDMVAERFGLSYPWEGAEVPVSARVSGLRKRSRAYIKIEDGCDCFCSYCVIPYARGGVRSRPTDEIVAEACGLIGRDYKEIVLTGVNMALYGSERAGSSTGGRGVIPVIDAISEIEGDYRIRLGSLEPTVINAAYACELIKRERLCPHLHLSLQSGSDSILRAMNRHYTMKEYAEIVDVLRARDPLWSVSTDIIVGFPGETDTDFHLSVKTVRDMRFSHVHVFKYSPRKGTAAADMPEQIPAETVDERSRILTEAAERSAEAFYEANRGLMRQTLFFDHAVEGTYEGITDNNITVRAEDVGSGEFVMYEV